MVKQITLLLGCCFAFLTGCNNITSKSGQAATADVLKGNWVCMDLLDKVKQTHSARMLGDFPPYTELLFQPDSSRLIAFNGQVDMAHLTYERKGNLVQVPEFYGGETTRLKLLNDSVLIFEDELQGRQWRYVKAAESMVNTEGLLPEAFPNMLNKNLLAGEYSIVIGGKSYDITLRNNGYIFGNPLYTRYSVCYGGDCANFCNEDLVYISNGKQGEYYGFRIQSNVVTVYSLRSVGADDEMPNYKYDSPLLELVKRK